MTKTKDVDRPYFDKKVEELTAIFEANTGSVFVLRDLKKELSYRSTPSAKALAEKVNNALKKNVQVELSNDAAPRPKIKPETTFCHSTYSDEPILQKPEMESGDRNKITESKTQNNFATNGRYREENKNNGINRFVGPFIIICYLSYFIIGFIQLYAVFSFFRDYWHWSIIFAGPISFLLAYCPVVGSVCGMYAAIEVWEWKWWEAGALFVWPLIASILYAAGSTLVAKFGGSSLPSSEGHKETIDVSKSNPSNTIKLIDLSQPIQPTPDTGKLEEIANMEQVEDVVVVPKRGFLYKLRHGEYSLAKTFWLFGLLVLTCVNMGLKSIITPSIIGPIAITLGKTGFFTTLIAFQSIYTIYCVNLYIGQWIAASKYTGFGLWSFLVKVITIIWWAGLVYGWIIFIGGMLQGDAPQTPAQMDLGSIIENLKDLRR